ncbi:MAG TPA: rod shape-determining protein MreC [Candidatus Angelobacter sp.]|jgi:rod shape-determining protein MreC|nr:rod shape-determining protein MreC [Candidatus Angelobacter sp.]
MENFFVRYKNPLALMVVVVIQVVALATQVKRPEGARAGNTGSGTRLIRVWTVTAFTPAEKVFVSTGRFLRNGWQNYADLRGARKQNKELQEQVVRLQMEQVRLKQDADQARRLQALLDFKENFISKTVAAQVIATSGTEQSRLVTIDKGSHDGIKPDMAVVTPDGIVGKVKDVFRLSSQVLLINDHDSGAGVILEHSRLQGIVKGTPLGELQINDIMSDEKVEPGERLITSGGDRIYPKGYAVGTVSAATPDRDNDPFLVIKIKPAADLNRLEEVLVITEMADNSRSAASGPAPMRAADILSQRLPSVPKVDPNAPKTPGVSPQSVPAATASPTPAKGSKTVRTGNEQKAGVQAGSAKPVTTGAGTAATASTANKTAAESKKQQALGQGSVTPASAGPKPTPKKTKSPAVTPDITTPDRPAATPTATPAANQEKPPR